VFPCYDHLVANEQISFCSAFVPLADLQEFTEKAKDDLLDRAPNIKVQKKYVQAYNDAVEQICKAYNELQKSSEAASGTLPDQSEKTIEHLVKSPDDGENLGLGRMEADSPTDDSNASGQGSGAEDVKDGGHEMGGHSSSVSQKKTPSLQDPEYPKTKKPVAPKSALDMYIEQEHSPTSVHADRETDEEVKNGKESRPPEGFILDPNTEVVCALEVPNKSKASKLLRNAERKEKRADIEAASDALNMGADKESREFKKPKSMTKQSLATGSEKRDHNEIVHGKPDKQLSRKSSAGFSSNKKSLPGSGQRTTDCITDTRPAKKQRLMDKGGETEKIVAQSDTKLSIDCEKHNAMKHERSTTVETGKITVPKTGISDGRVRRSGSVLSPISRLHSEVMEPASGSAAKSTVADSAKKGSIMKEDASRVDRQSAKPKRRACRFDDDEDEGQRTPLHRTSAKSISTHTIPADKAGTRGKMSSHAGNASLKKTAPAREEKSKSVGLSPVRHELVCSSPSQDKLHARHQAMGRRSITGSVDTSAGMGNKTNLVDRKSSGQVKMPTSSETKKIHSSSKQLHLTSGNSHSRNHPASEKNMLPKLEDTKAKSKPGAQSVEHKVSTTVTVSAERGAKQDHLKEERYSALNFERTKFLTTHLFALQQFYMCTLLIVCGFLFCRPISIDKAASSEPNSDKSMKHLIAAAQARRNLMASHGKFDGSLTDNAGMTSTPYGLPGLSPSPVFRIPSPSRIAFPESPGERIVLKSPTELDHEHGKSPKSRQVSGSPSIGTDAAIARDALEGMIETLSRTKESIGRATRHAIECSKYGIAGEVLSLSLKDYCPSALLLHHYCPYYFSHPDCGASHTEIGERAKFASQN
jgi:hypothetical protein